MEAFDLAVGLRAPGPCPVRRDGQVAAGVAPGVLAVGPCVVGQDAFDRDAEGGEGPRWPLREAGAGQCGLVGQVFGVGRAGVVVERGGQAGVSGTVAAAFVRGCRPPGPGLCDRRRRGAAQLLDVDGDQLARAGWSVAADGLAWGPVQDGQQRHGNGPLPTPSWRRRAQVAATCTRSNTDTEHHEERGHGHSGQHQPRLPRSGLRVRAHRSSWRIRTGFLVPVAATARFPTDRAGPVAPGAVRLLGVGVVRGTSAHTWR
ncbi:Uncharacterised protein [Streptomyces griseus]|uniref:Uncharacterized protein n=1 Tax=Streptomyces griseus TaxID=1911 RepID=A0A380PAH7_STRGR|nr:Uncharacterised protein [Streptomyces griseus]